MAAIPMLQTVSPTRAFCRPCAIWRRPASQPPSGMVAAMTRIGMLTCDQVAPIGNRGHSEADSRTELNRPGAAGLACEHAKVCWAIQTQRWSSQVDVVKYIEEVE